MLISYATLFSLAIAAVNAAPAAPAGLQRSVAPRGFEVAAIHNTNKVRNGTRELHKAFAKYNLNPTKTMNSLVSKRQDGSVSATPATDDVEYLASAYTSILFYAER